MLWGLPCPVQGKLIKGERTGSRLGEKAGEAVVGHGEEAGKVGLCIPRSFCPRAEVDSWKHLLGTIHLANGLKKKFFCFQSVLSHTGSHQGYLMIFLIP